VDQLTRIAGRRRGAPDTAGFTLLEVVVALGLLAFGLLGVAAMQIHALQGGRSSRHTTQGAEIARTQLELFQNLAFADLGATTWTTPQVVTRSVQAEGETIAEQDYDLRWRITDLNAPATLKSIDVQVTWSEPDRSNRVVTLSTLRFEE
jgi:type IV pilus assembly protein PilV